MFIRSADQGIEYLGLVAKHAQQNKLAEYLSTKHESIMKQFVSEVGAVEHEFMVIFLIFPTYFIHCKPYKSFFLG